MCPVSAKQRTQLKHLIKGLLPVACRQWWRTGVLEVLTIVGWRLLIARIGVALVCIRRILHGRSRRVLPVALAARTLGVVGVCFSTLSLRHLSRRRGKVAELSGLRDAIEPVVIVHIFREEVVKVMGR